MNINAFKGVRAKIGFCIKDNPCQRFRKLTCCEGGDNKGPLRLHHDSGDGKTEN
jgi:hypothetical protein